MWRLICNPPGYHSFSMLDGGQGWGWGGRLVYFEVIRSDVKNIISIYPLLHLPSGEHWGRREEGVEINWEILDYICVLAASA